MDDWAAGFSKSIDKILLYQFWAEAMNVGPRVGLRSISIIP